MLSYRQMHINTTHSVIKGSVFQFLQSIMDPLLWTHILNFLPHSIEPSIDKSFHCGLLFTKSLANNFTWEAARVIQGIQGIWKLHSWSKFCTEKASSSTEDDTHFGLHSQNAKSALMHRHNSTKEHLLFWAWPASLTLLYLGGGSGLLSATGNSEANMVANITVRPITCQRLFCGMSESTLKRSRVAWAIKIIITL